MTIPDNRYDALAASAMVEGRPTPETAARLREELLFQRATQTYLWALPLINTLGMKFGSEKTFGAGYHVLPIWKKRLDARTLITTPNSDLIYAMGYVDLGADGPLVFDAPPMMQGILLDVWQRPIPGPSPDFEGDVGFFGPDAGQGGKFLILPPGYDRDIPPGYLVFRSATNNVFIFLRSFYRDANDLAPAVDLVERARVYPLGAEDWARPMQYPDASGVPVNMLPASDATAFDQIKQVLDTEEDDFIDPDWRGMLASLGLVRGRPFRPDAATRAMLDRAARTGYKMSRVIGREEVVDGHPYRVYPDRRWTNPANSLIWHGKPTFDLSWRAVGSGFTMLDSRINFFTNYYSISPGMVSRSPGTGANYMVLWVDKAGDPLTGAERYQLVLPPGVPAANFWSVTLYDAEHSSGLANGQPFPSLGSRDVPVQEPDGSTTLYFGPTAPEGREHNWLRTPPGRGYFAILRLYGPTERIFDQTWKPGDFERRP